VAQRDDGRDSAPETLRIFAGGYASIARRVAVLDDVVRGAAHEPDAKAVRGHSEQLRRDGYHTIIEHVQTHYGLRADLDTDKATDLTLTLAGLSVYSTLVVDYGWAHTAFVDWLARTLTDMLLPPATAN
jgi:hypothetical protein